MTSISESAGELGFLAAADLLRDVAVRRATGQLVAWRGPATKKVFCKNGFVIFATSDVEADRLGDVLLSRGMITREQYEESASQVIATGRKQGTVLVQIGALTPKDLFRGLIAQVREIVLSLFAWDRGGWRFIEGLPEQGEIVSLRLHPTGLAFEGVARAAADPRFAELWRPAELAVAAPGPEAQAGASLDLPPAADRLVEALGQGLTWPAAVARSGAAEREAAALLYVLALFGVVEATARPREPAAPAGAPPPAAAPAAGEADARESEETAALRRKVRSLAATLATLNFYQLLGLTPQAEPEALKRAYIDLAKEYHPDRFYREPLADLLDDAGAIFLRINEAYTTLGNAAARAAYDREVLQLGPAERTAGPEPDSRLAQEQFRKGLAQLKEGDLWSAIQSLRWAVNLNPQNPRFHTYLGVALTRSKKRLHEAEEHCKTAIALDYNNGQYYVHLGQVYRAGHLYEKARQQYEQALKLDPKHPQALRELEELRKAEGSKGARGIGLGRVFRR